MKLLLTLTLLFNFAFANIDDDIKTFVKDFKSKRNEAKYYKELKSLDKEKLNKILTRYKQSIKLINPNNIPEDKLSKILQKSLDNNVYYIYKFYKEVYRAKGKAEYTAIKHEKKVPELQGSKVIEFEKQEGQVADVKAKVALLKERAKGKKLDKDMAGLNKDIAGLDKDIANKDKKIANLLKKLDKILNK